MKTIISVKTLKSATGRARNHLKHQFNKRQRLQGRLALRLMAAE